MVPLSFVAVSVNMNYDVALNMIGLSVNVNYDVALNEIGLSPIFFLMEGIAWGGRIPPCVTHKSADPKDCTQID